MCKWGLMIHRCALYTPFSMFKFLKRAYYRGTLLKISINFSFFDFPHTCFLDSLPYLFYMTERRSWHIFKILTYLWKFNFALVYAFHLFNILNPPTSLEEHIVSNLFENPHMKLKRSLSRMILIFKPLGV